MVNSLFEVFRLNVCVHIEVENITMFYYYHQTKRIQATFYAMFFLLVPFSASGIKVEFCLLIDEQPHRNEKLNLSFISISFSFWIFLWVHI